jgi:hypothetical protein
MRFMQLLAVTLGVLSASSSLAGTCPDGCKVKNIGVGSYYDSICTSAACVFVAIDSAPTGKPACSANSYWHFALDISTPSGRATYAFLLEAFASGRSINATGTNTCALSPSGSVENLYWVNYAQ